MCLKDSKHNCFNSARFNRLLEGGTLYCRKRPVCIRESLHLDRPRWCRVLAIPHLLRAALGIRRCGWKITSLEVFMKVGGPSISGEVGNTCSFTMPEITDRWLFLFCPPTCRMTCTRYLVSLRLMLDPVPQEAMNWCPFSHLYNTCFAVVSADTERSQSKPVCGTPPLPPCPSRSILHDLSNIS
jgi:hypothetical protein